MNLTRIISIKERIAISSEWKPDERDFILECINIAVEAQAILNQVKRKGAVYVAPGDEKPIK